MTLSETCLLSLGKVQSTVSVLEFMPKSGPVGTTVTIYGTAFSTTPSQNIMTFNSVAATVTSSIQTKIVVTVPSGATTGVIAITAPGGSAASGTAFTVTASSAVPTITSFTPSIGAPGTAVTITGTNFDTTPSRNVTRFNVGHAIVSTATSTSISSTVPSGTSGRISVTTSMGKAVNNSDFFIPPASYAAADISFTSRMTVGGSSVTAAFPTASKIGLVVFDGIAGNRIGLGITGVTIASSDLYVLNPDGSTLTSLLNFNGSRDLDFALPTSGTYTIFVDPRSTYTGSMTLNLSADLVGTIIPGGPGVTVNLTTPGQRAKLNLSGTIGQKFSLLQTAMTFSSCVDISISKPDQSYLIAPTFLCDNGSLSIMTLPQTGIYSVVVNPRSAATGSTTIYLPVDVIGTITPGGTAVPLTIGTPGQNALLTFSGNANDKISGTLTAAGTLLCCGNGG